MDTWDHMHSDVGAYVLSIISMNDESVDSSADKLHSLYSRRARHLAHMQVVSQVPGFQPRTSAPLSTPSRVWFVSTVGHSSPRLTLLAYDLASFTSAKNSNFFKILYYIEY